MPGFILHLTAAQMLLKHLPSHPDFPYPISSVNDFLIGNLLPDATQQKESSHFRDPLYREKMMVFPDLTRFTAKYRSLLPDSSALGYYFHLYIDRKFFKDFIPQIVEFYNADGEITDMRDENPFMNIHTGRVHGRISQRDKHHIHSFFQISHGGVLLRGLYTNEYISYQPLLHPARSQS